MAFEYGFYNSISGDRKYNALDFGKVFDGVITDGVFADIGDKMFTTPGTLSMEVLVGTGKAWFNHTWNLNTSPISFIISASHPVLTRYDAIVLEVNETQDVYGRVNEIKVVEGTPSSNAVKPTLVETEHIHQHPLAYIKINPEATTLVAADIEITVGQTSCPFVTSILQQTDITTLFANWESQFDIWFTNLKTQLTDDVVTNLQNQIDNCLKVTDIATQADIDAGTAGKVVTAPFMKTAIDEMSYKVGDIVSTLRADLGDNWLLCNGDDINPDEYPDLVNVLHNYQFYNNRKYIINSNLNYTAPHFYATNGNSVLYLKAMYYGSTSGVQYCSATMSYTNNIFATVTDISGIDGYAMGTTGGLSYNVPVVLIKYFAPYWLIITRSSYSGGSLYFYASTTLKGSGWSQKTVTIADIDSTVIQGIEKYNDTYWAFGIDNTGPWYAQLSSLWPPPSAIDKIHITKYRKRQHFIRNGNRFVFFCTGLNNETAGSAIDILESETPSGPWIHKGPISLGGSAYRALPYAVYSKGKYIFNWISSSGSNCGMAICDGETIETFATPITFGNIGSIIYSPSSQYTYNPLVSFGDYVIYISGSGSSPDSTRAIMLLNLKTKQFIVDALWYISYQTVSITGSSSSGNTYLYCTDSVGVDVDPIVLNNHIYVGGSSVDGSMILDIPFYSLPTLSQNGLYSYIKAKETI